jgi:hypothetical protein
MKSEYKMRFLGIILLTSGYQLVIIVLQYTEQCLGSQSRGGLWTLPLKGGNIRDGSVFSK